MFYIYIDGVFHEIVEDFKKARDYCLLNKERYGWKKWSITNTTGNVIEDSEKENTNPRLP
jgi:hypothetical protein